MPTATVHVQPRNTSRPAAAAKKLLRSHRFLATRFFYPLLFSTVFAIAVYSARVLRSKELTFAFLVWNLFLAWLPYWCAIGAELMEANTRSGARRFLFVAAVTIWFIFFPNAPYVITDLLHVNARSGAPLWYDVGLITSFGLSGTMIGVGSLWAMQNTVRLRWGRGGARVLTIVTLGATGIGIAMGRFARWNSWDLLFHPTTVLADVIPAFLNPSVDPRMPAAALLYGGLFAVIYSTFATACGTKVDCQRGDLE